MASFENKIQRKLEGISENWALSGDRAEDVTDILMRKGTGRLAAPQSTAEWGWETRGPGVQHHLPTPGGW